MRRRSVHGLFALLAAVAAALVVVQGLRLQQARVLNAKIVLAAQVAPARGASPPAAAGASGAARGREASAPGDTLDAAASPGVPREAPREVRLAEATALSAAGAFDAAFKAYSGLIDPARLDAVGRHALYNLGNMVLRQGLNLDGRGAPTDGPPRTPEEAGPLIELAKQRYRDLLRADPHDWDARYNLERALRAAPEELEAPVEEANTPVERRNVMLRGMKAGDLP